MTDVRRRRPRYAGTHPRRFDEKYKEHAPDRYPDLVARLRAKGRTPAGQHVPILVAELVDALAPRSGDRVVDATLGWGGHAEAMIARILPGGQLLGVDVDPDWLPRTTVRLQALGFDDTVFQSRRANFAGLGPVIESIGWTGGADVIYADLGVSSMQIDDPARGFSFRHEGPLDMRMNPARRPTAGEWLATASVEDLAHALLTFADEPAAEPIARAIVQARGSLVTTKDLVRLVTGVPEVARARAPELVVRRVFQAVRVQINDELGALDAFLRAAPFCLRPGGRLGVITFHSGEDRRVKRAFAAGQRDGTYAAVSPEVIRASAAERRANTRAAAAKLRWARAA